MNNARILFACMILTGATVMTSRATADSNGAEKPTTIFVVRHAEKADQTRTTDLSATGKARARTLAWILRDVVFDAILSTDTLRTRATVQPVADASDLSVGFYVPRPGELADTISKKHRGHTVLVCGHSNTIPVLLKNLGCPIKENILDGYDDLFIVTLSIGGKNNTRIATLQRLHYPVRYVPANAPSPSQ